MMEPAIRNLILRLADDLLILGHRNSEWIGLGPVLEEDIAFGSMAQDKVGQAQALYALIQQTDGDTPDKLAFARSISDYRCCHLVEFPNQDYAFSLMRQFLFDYAFEIRLQALIHCSYDPLKKLAIKMHREHKYHLLHARTFILQLGNANEESHALLQAALTQTYEYGAAIFEATEFDLQLKEMNIQPTENDLFDNWEATVIPILQKAQLHAPTIQEQKPFSGGRAGIHTPHLEPLISEMNVVFQSDLEATW